MAHAKTFALPFERVERLVKPERMSQKDAGGREMWWMFLRPRVEMYSAISTLPHCFVAVWVTKYLSFSAQPTDIVFTNSCYVFTTDRWDLFAVVQSNIHEVWARKYSGALETRLRYSPSDCFDTYAFPDGLWQSTNPTLASIGEQYHEYRRNLMLSLWLGLTDVYNLFHSSELEEDLKKHFASRAKKDPEGRNIAHEHGPRTLAFKYEQALAGVLELRKLHVQLDNAVLGAYGWNQESIDGPALDLQHNFYDVETLAENDRNRFTISPAARKELLARLLKENHRRSADEAAKPTVATPKAKGKRTKQIDSGEGSLYGACDG